MCPEPESMANTQSITTTGRVEGKETTYDCQSDYYFLDGKTSQTVTCQSNGNWTATSVCTSKSMVTITCQNDGMWPATTSVYTSKSISHKYMSEQWAATTSTNKSVSHNYNTKQ